MGQKNLGLLLAGILLVLFGVAQLTTIDIRADIARFVYGGLATASGVCLLLSR